MPPPAKENFRSTLEDKIKETELLNQRLETELNNAQRKIRDLEDEVQKLKGEARTRHVQDAGPLHQREQSNTINRWNDENNNNTKRPPLSVRTVLGLRVRLGMQNLDCRKIAETIKSKFRSLPGASISFKIFSFVLKKLSSAQTSKKTFFDISRQLFNFLDRSNDGALRKHLTAQFFILMGQGDKREKIEAIFRYFDVENSGKMNKNDVLQHFLDSFQILQNGDNKINCAALARVVSQEIGDNSAISLSNFLKIALRAGDLLNREENDREANTGLEIENENKSISRVKSLVDLIRKGLPFEKIHLSVALHILERSAGEIQAIDKMRFKTYLKEVIDTLKLTIRFKDSLDTVPSLFFDVYDVFNNGIIGKAEIAAGLFILCGRVKTLIL